MSRASFLLFLTALAARAACIPVAEQYIRVRHLAGAEPAFAELDPELVIGPAPLPGVQRTFGRAELAALLQSSAGTDTGSLHPVCAERQLAPLTALEVADAIRRALPSGAQLTVVSYTNTLVPPGVIEFPKTGLQGMGARSASELFTWRGRLVYGSHRSVPVWAKVRIERRVLTLTAARSIHAGQVIAPLDVITAEAAVSPWLPDLIGEPAGAIGRRCRRVVRAGDPITESVLAGRPAVQKGDSVLVVFNANTATITLSATAEAEGAVGEAIWLRNPVNGERFQGRVVDREHVSVKAGAGLKHAKKSA